MTEKQGREERAERKRGEKRETRGKERVERKRERKRETRKGESREKIEREERVSDVGTLGQVNLTL